MRRAAWIVVSAGALLCASPSIAASSTKEPDCSKALSVWQRVSAPEARAYCLHIQRGYARLASEPKQAASFAESALAILPAGVQAKVLRAGATLFQGDPALAHAEFERVGKEASPVFPFSRPGTLAQAARAALLSGDYERAHYHYRRVVLRLGEIPGPRERARLLIEAATAATYAAPGRGPEARAYLATASAENEPLLRPVVEAAWALSFARDGEMAHSRPLVSDWQSSWQVRFMFDDRPARVGRPEEVLPVLPLGEAKAYAAVVALVVEPEAAPLHWAEFVEEAGSSLPERLRLIPKR